MKAIPLVCRDRIGTKELRQFSGGLPANQVHLEETILPMGEAGCKGKIIAASRRDNRNPAAVSGDCRRIAKALYRNLPIQFREARSQNQPAGNQDQRHRAEGADKQVPQQLQLESSVTRRIFMALVLPDTPSRSPFVKMTRSPTST